jgi:putative addiction module killer protein
MKRLVGGIIEPFLYQLGDSCRLIMGSYFGLVPKSLGDGIYELRFDFGSGYRVYFAEQDSVIVLLLCGGDKSTQSKDMETAKNYWKEFRRQLL